MKFVQFVTAQMEPFGGMPVGFGMKYDDMRKPLSDLLIELSGEKPLAEQPTALAWAKTRPGDRVASVCRECATFDEVPTVAIIRGVWRTMFPPAATSKNCPYCHGDNWVTGDGPHGLTAAQPCDHTGNLNPNLGIVLSARENERYAQEAEEARKRGEEWRASPAFQKHITGDPEGMKRARVPLDVSRYL